MKITTWNVNGIRARLTHVLDFLRQHEPDVLCLQETKVVDDLFPRQASLQQDLRFSPEGSKIRLSTSKNGVVELGWFRRCSLICLLKHP